MNTKHGPVFTVAIRLNDCGNYLPGLRKRGDTVFLEYRKYGCNECDNITELSLHYELDDPSLADYTVYFNDTLLHVE